jgi:alpha-glucosidase (family GH31 glycosyl hydrolase)
MGPTLLETARQSLQFRYSMLKQLYTEFLAKRGFGTIYRPLFMEFDVDAVLNASVLETQFLVGNWLMVAPIL